MDVASLFNERDKLARFLGIKVTKANNGYAEAMGELKEEHKNGLNIAHGGFIFTLADLAFAAASNSHGKKAVAIEVSISYIKPITEGILTAVAEEISNGKNISRYIVKVLNQKKEVCALFKGTAYKLD